MVKPHATPDQGADYEFALKLDVSLQVSSTGYGAELQNAD